MTEDQFEAVRADSSKLRILAGAGTGKTRVLTYRIAYQINAVRIEPEHTLCLAFTNKAAQEIKSRLGHLGNARKVHTGTFHSIAYSQVKARWKDIGTSDTPKLITDQKSHLSRVLPSNLGSPERNFVLSEINWAIAQRVPVEEYIVEAGKANRQEVIPFAAVAEHFRGYINLKKKRNLIDFDDIIKLAIQFLADDPNYAAARHWKFNDLFVDEFQDVNPLQFSMLQAWLGPSSTLTVVGDPNQAIYSWNGADARYLNDFEKYFPSSQTITLKDNFRSTPQILSAAVSVLPQKVDLDPQLPDGEPPTIRAEHDDRAEAKSIARLILNKVSEGFSFGDQAVLVRTHAQIAPIIEAFGEHNIGFAVATDASPNSDGKNANVVQILTLHSAKGLEWKIVHLCGIEMGFHPIAHATSQDSRDEERRLFFVAMTRAEKELHISWARKRFIGSRRDRRPSVYLDEIAQFLNPIRVNSSDNKSNLSSRIRKFRQTHFGTNGTYIPTGRGMTHIEELDLLRKNIAKVNDLKPDVVFSDDLMEEIVRRKPKSLEELKQIPLISPTMIDLFGNQIIEIFS